MLCQELLDVLVNHVVGNIQNLDAHICAVHYDNLHNLEMLIGLYISFYHRALKGKTAALHP